MVLVTVREYSFKIKWGVKKVKTTLWARMLWQGVRRIWSFCWSFEWNECFDVTLLSKKNLFKIRVLRLLGLVYSAIHKIRHSQALLQPISVLIIVFQCHDGNELIFKNAIEISQELMCEDIISVCYQFQHDTHESILIMMKEFCGNLDFQNFHLRPSAVTLVLPMTLAVWFQKHGHQKQEVYQTKTFMKS